MSKDIVLPSITCEEKDQNKAIFTVKPLYPGYGMTVGNSLRRVMLSSLPGASVISIKVKGADHEFSTIPHVKEDIIEVILNLKQLRMKVTSDEIMKITIKEKGKKVIKAKDIKLPSQVKVINPDLVIATLGEKGKFEAEIEVNKGLGYVPIEEREEEKEIDKILIDAIYTPIKKVRYNVDNVRVGKKTDFDQVTFEIETDGSISPRKAFAQSARLLVNHFDLFSSLDQTKKVEKNKKGKSQATKETTAMKKNKTTVDIKKLGIEEIGLSVRTERVLAENGIKTVAGLLRLSESILQEKEGVGGKAIQEIKSKLKKLNLNLKE